ncbi:MAG: ADP-ribosylation/Crystallin [Cyanobacteria bacterium RYN_339]|nr:ADP-ribosylation/Crystallin [Cyanobacteria bacterium RYN_339]
MANEMPVNCTLCDCLAGDRCTFHEVELDNPTFSVCRQFRLPEEPPEAALAQYPGLGELSPDWIYELDVGGEAAPLVQVARRRRQRGRNTGKLPFENADLPEVTVHEAVDRRDRFAGALLGVGIGDALGFPAEGRGPSEIEMIYGGPIRGYAGRIGRRHTWPVGQVTKDTQLVFCLGESLVEAGELDMDDFAERLIRWLPSSLRAGKSTAQSVQALAEGRHWSVCGIESNGAGSTVRVVPLALLLHEDLGRLRQAAILQSMPTHQAAKAYAGAVLMATAVATLANTPRGELKPADWLSLLERAIRGIDFEMSAALHDVAACLSQHLPAAAALLRFKTGGYVLECLPAALYCFLRHPDDPERALLAAANGGFAASSVAAMAGAMVGAYHGRSGLPAQLVDGLPVASGLIALSERLHARLPVRVAINA